jgi:pimeloyl-ACP methyl ester carboxylesterase
MVDLLHRLGRRPGARFAPQAFIAGRLNLNIAAQFGALPQPVLIAWGKHAGTTPLSGAPAFLERNPKAVLKVFDDAALVPHDEQADVFNARLLEWLEGQQT